MYRAHDILTGDIMQNISTSHDLFLLEICKLLDAEQRFAEALPELAKTAHHPELKEALELHAEQTQEQISRLQKVGEVLEADLEPTANKVVKTMIEEGQELLESISRPVVRDVALVKIIQAGEHYEIAAYGSVMAHAKVMHHNEALKLLEDTLREEEQTDSLLSDLAERTINPAAVEVEEE
jgi:ferritin-like metal-binding protein YciE